MLGGNGFGYVAAEAAYRGGDEWLEEVKEQIQENYQYLKIALNEKIPKAIVAPLEGTYLVWIDLSSYVDPQNIKEFMQKKCRIAVDYGEWFGGERFAGCIRINLATSLDNVKKGVEAICNHIL